MKRILATTDFSTPATNAVEYAAALAYRFEGEVLLFHVYRPPLSLTGVPVIFPDLDNLRDDCLTRLQNLCADLKKKYRGIRINYEVQMGLAVDQICNFITEYKPSLLVMGMHGDGSAMSFTGSTTTALIKKSTVPVLSVHSNIKFKVIRSIVFATDYKEISNAHLKPVQKIADKFGSHVYFLNVINNHDEVPFARQVVAGMNMKNNLELIKHSFEYESDSETLKGIDRFVSQHKADLLVMIPAHHSMLEGLFKKSLTRKMAFQAKIPLLTIKTN